MRKSALLLLALVALVPFTEISAQAQSVMTHHVRDAVRNGEAKLVGHLPADQVMNLDVVLSLSDAAGLDSFLSAVANPASPSYRHYLTVSEFTAQFGPSQTDYDAAVNFLTANGFTVTGGSRDGMDVQVAGPVSAVESAFHISMRTYKHPTESRNFYGPDTEPTTSLPFSLWHVSGLDNYSIPQPMLVNREAYAAANHINAKNAVDHATTGSGPGASFLGSDMRAAYYGGTALDGSGQNLGLFEYLGTDLADLNTYFTNIGQTNSVPITLVSTDGSSTACVDNAKGGNCDDTEQTLDMTQALGMAPKLASLVMYVGNTDTAIISAMTTHSPLPTTIGCSWGWRPADPAALDPYFKRMAAQGQTFFVASGDSSTWTAGKYVWPADDPYIVSVGGTDLVTASAGGPWQSETAWADSGGGISPDSIAIPSWQQLAGVINSSNRGSTTLRNGPDVSANANFTFYTCANQKACLANTYGGTSFAAPMWAGYVALANQLLASQSKGPVGFINATIYSQNLTASYATDFHDIVSGTSGSYSAVTGYDLVTGWGSPTPALITALTSGTTQIPAMAVSASPASVSIKRGGSANVTITSSISGGFNSAVALSASSANGVTVSFTPSSIAAPGSGTSTMKITVASNASTGSRSITVTGTGGSLTETTTVTVKVTK